MPGLGRRDLLKSAFASPMLAQVETTNIDVDVEAGEKLWEFETDSWTKSSPTVVDGNLYVNSGDNLYSLDAVTGEENWRVDDMIGTTDMLSSPNVVDNTVYTCFRHLHAVDAESGNRLWEYDLGNPSHKSSPTVIGDSVYIATSNAVYAIDAESGQEVWSATVEVDGTVGLPGNSFNSTVVADGTVYACAGGKLYAMDASDGDVEWVYDSWSRGLDVNPLKNHITRSYGKSSPTLKDDTVYFSTSYQRYEGFTMDAGTGLAESEVRLHAVDATTGREKWRKTGIASPGTPTVFGGTLYVGVGDGLHAVDTETGETMWEVEPEDETDISPSSPTYADGTVFVGDTDGEKGLYSIDTETQELNWGFEAGEVESSPTVVDGVVFFGTNEDKVYAVGTDVDGSSEGSRVNLATLGHHDSWTGEDEVEVESPSLFTRANCIVSDVVGVLLNPFVLLLLFVLGLVAYDRRYEKDIHSLLKERLSGSAEENPEDDS